MNDKLYTFLRFDNCQMTVLRITWLPENCWWLPESCWWLPGTCLMTALTNVWRLLDVCTAYVPTSWLCTYLRTAWKRIDNCQMTAWELLDCLRITWLPEICWWLSWQMPEDCLMTTYLSKYVMTTMYLRTAWKRIDNCQMTAWELLDCLKIADDCLASAWWLPWQMSDDCLMTTYLRTAWRRIFWGLPYHFLHDDCLKTKYFTTKTLSFMTDNNKITKTTGLWRFSQPKNPVKINSTAYLNVTLFH